MSRPDMDTYVAQLEQILDRLATVWDSPAPTREMLFDGIGEAVETYRALQQSTAHPPTRTVQMGSTSSGGEIVLEGPYEMPVAGQSLAERQRVKIVGPDSFGDAEDIGREGEIARQAEGNSYWVVFEDGTGMTFDVESLALMPTEQEPS